MKRFSAEMVFAAPAEIVWRTLADIAHWPDWDPNTEEASGVPAKDARLVFLYGYARGRRVEARVTAMDEPFLLEWTGGNEQVTSVRTHRLMPEGTGCRVEVSQVFFGPGLGQADVPELRGPFREFLMALRARVEDGIHAVSGTGRV